PHIQISKLNNLLIITLELSNKKAYYEYFFESKFIAGLVLQGTEIKSLRVGKASFNDSYCVFQQGELFVKSLHISEYAYGTYTNHEPMQERKLLLNKRELVKLEAKTKEKGYSIIPLRIFISEKGLAKMEIGLGKGKKVYDKRNTIKERENDRDIKRKYGV
ncbi:MAG: SsrA-binding protein SmpB, partial [Ferruginibacter sp.]